MTPRTGLNKAIRLAAAVLAAVVLLSVLLVVTRAPLENWARARVLSEVESATGGRATAGKVSWNLRGGEVELLDLTVHGREPEDAPPYLHADRVLARLRHSGIFGVALSQLDLARPEIHVVTFSDGSNNIPQPVVPGGRNSRVQSLIATRIGRLEARDGALYVNDRHTPFDFSANDAQLRLDYQPAGQQYEGAFSASRVEGSYRGLRRIAATARAKFTLSSSKLLLSSISLASGPSRLEGGAEIDDFNRPSVQFMFDAELDLAQAGATLGSPQFRSGHLQVHGLGKWSDGRTSCSGKVLLANALYQTGASRLPIESAWASYQLDDRGLTLSGIVAHALGGTADGSAQVAGWTQSAGAGTGRGSASLRLHDLSFAELLAAAPNVKRQLGGMNLVGSASGDLALAWRGSPRDAEAKLSLQVGPPSSDPPQDVPVTGHIDLEYGPRGTKLSNVDLATQKGSRLRAQGTLADNSRLQVSFTTEDLSQFQPLLTALALGEQVPTNIHGRASFDGLLTGNLSAPSLAGRLELFDFDALMVPVHHGASRHPVHLDHFLGNVEYSPTVVAARHASLRSGSVDARLDVSAALQHGKLAAGAPLSARVSFQRASIDDVQRLAGTSYPVSGLATVSLDISGTRDQLRGGGPVQISGGAVYGQPFKSLSAELHLQSGEVRLQELRVRQDGGTVSGTVSYRPADDGLLFDLAGAGFAVSDFPQLRWPRLKISGTAGFHATGEGTLAQPIVTADLSFRNVVLNSERPGDFDLHGVTRGRQLQLAGSAVRGDARLDVKGNILLGGDYPATVNVRLSRVDVDPLIETLTPVQLTGHSSVTGVIDVSGPLRHPRSLTARGDLEQFRLSLENVGLANQGPIRLSYSGQTMRVDALHLVGPDTDLRADGTVSFIGDRVLDLHADGRMNLKLLESMNPEISAYGRTAMAVSATGPLAHPTVQGQVYIRDAGISYTDLPNGLANLNGTLVFNQNRLVIQKLSAQTGGGTLDLGGFIAYDRGIYFNLTATGKSIRIRYPEGVSLQADANLHYTGTFAGSLLAGDVLVDRFDVTPQFDLALYIARSIRPAPGPTPSRALDNVKFDVHITSAPELEVQASSGFKVTGDADLRVRGTAARPAVLGRVEISEGEVKFNNTTYQLDRGDITFTNPTLIEPVFNIEATTRVRDYDITIGFHGKADRLRTTYRSDPPLPEGDIIALLAMGRTRDESPTLSSQTTSPFTEAASNAILGAAISNVLSSRAQRLFGLSQIKIDPSVGGPDNNPNARLTIEQQVSGRVTLTYITNLAQSAQQVIQAEFQINRNLSIIGVRDQYGVVGFDVRYRHRKK